MAALVDIKAAVFLLLYEEYIECRGRWILLVELRAMFFLILYTTERVQSIKCTFLLIIFVVLQMVNITPERRRFS